MTLFHSASNLASNNPIPAYRGISDAITNIYHTEGFAALYRGVAMNIIAGSIANSLFFYIYQDGKKRYEYDSSNPYSVKTLLISYRAGIISMAVTAPMWTVKTRMALFKDYENRKMTSREIFTKIVTEMYHREGILSFYKGFIPSIFMSTYGVIQMSSYEMLTHSFGFESGSAKKITWDNMLVPFLIGGTSRSLASCILMPVNVVRMRLQMKSYTTDEIKLKHLEQQGNVRKEVKYDGMIDVIRKMYT